jgi:predicted dehydrogenase
MINIGVIGLGFMAATHLKSYAKLPNARIASLCNASGRNLDGDFSKVAGNIGDKNPLRLDMSGVKAYRDYRELLADPRVDVVDICAPTFAHCELAVAALEAGKHVLCEKPVARDPDEARLIADAAAKAKGIFMPALCIRFWPEYAWVKQAIDDGRFGKVLGARFRRVSEPPGWGNFMDGKRSGGALLDLHIHDVDFALHCFGKPKEIFAGGYPKVSGAIDHAMAQWTYGEGGPSVQLEGGWAMAGGFGFNMSFTLNFERATVDFDIARGADGLKLFESAQAPRVVTLEPSDGYVEELRYFLNCIETGRKPARVTAADAVTSVELCFLEEESIQTGRVVAVG